MLVNEEGIVELESGDEMQLEHGDSPNCGPMFRETDMLFILAHWTAGSTLDSARSWLSNPIADASAHCIVGRDGKICQLVEMNKIAWHAGPSKYKTMVPKVGEREFIRLNRYAIGIEFVNLGMLRKTEAGVFVSSTGRVVASDDVVKSDVDGKYYQLYPHAQIQAGLMLMAAIKKAYPTIFGMMGHMDVAPGRKFDPGPEFPMDYLRSKLFGRADGFDEDVMIAKALGSGTVAAT